MASWFLVVLVVLASGGRLVEGQLQDRWSGLVNDLEDTIDFLCPNNSVLTGIASDFSGSDRRWEFRCGTAERLASTAVTCTLQPAINVLQGDISYSCPNNGYLGGFRSEYTSASSDRVWNPYCCTRPFSSLINCQFPNLYVNDLRANLNTTAPPGNVLAGVQGFYFSRDRRWRYQTCQIEVNCGDPGVPDNGRRLGDSFLFTSNVTFVCDDGYYQSSGAEGGVRECLISGEWSGDQPICSRCGAIENCAQVLCTNSTDHSCMECEGNHMVTMAYSNLGNQCEARCSWLRAFCYPGVCPDMPSSCSCLDGFEGPSCLQITTSPTLSQCSLTLSGSGGQRLPVVCLHGNDTSSGLLFTNIVPHELLGAWQMTYITPDVTSISRPPYVHGYSVGVAMAELTTTVYRASNPTLAASRTSHACSPYTPDNPVPGQNPCSVTATPTSLANHTFLHGDRLEMLVHVAAGGYLDILNLDTTDVLRHYYQGRAAVEGVVFIIDLQPPVHCSLETPPTCATSEERLLSLSGEIVREDSISVTWGGWMDVPSGVLGYQLVVYPLGESGGLLNEGAAIQTIPYNHSAQMLYEEVVVLPSEGPYSVVLETLDVAGNIRFARRVVLFDNSSYVAADPARPLTVSSAVPQSDYLWQNSTTLPVTVDVEGHFYNSHFQSSDLLAPLGNFSDPLQEQYDQPLVGGQLPREGTPNSLGIVRLRYDYLVDQLGGVSLDHDTPPQIFRFSIAPALEEVGVTPQLQDGDSVRIWFQAEDFRSQQLSDSVLVHIDSSSPVLNGLVLVRNGVTGLSHHWSETLTSLNIQFDVSDPHSGIMVLEWSIGTETGLNNVGYGSIAVANCSMQQADCVCDILGGCVPVHHAFSPPLSGLSSSELAHHGATYHVTVTATNHAYLSSSVTIIFTIDATPPLRGVVLDAPPGGADVDYQSSLTLHGWWEGFFDRETGVNVYQYQYSRECLNTSHFTYPLHPGSDVMETNADYATAQADGEGTFFLTVVAWNSALSPSPPVCSDGLTVDLTPPTFEGVTIPGIRTEGGLARVAGGEVWLVGMDRTRRLVQGGRGNSSCTSVATEVQDLSTYPISEGERLSVEVCLLARPLSSSPRTVITQGHTLNFTWEAYDNIGMRDYYIGIYSPQEFAAVADITDAQDLSRTGGFPHFSLTDPDLLSHGNSFYLLVRAEDVTGLRSTISIGPVLIDQTPPLVNGSVYVEQQSGHVIVMWDQETFTDPEEGDSITLQYAIGLTRYGEEVLPYEPLPTTPSTCPLPSTSCFTLPLSSLSLTTGHIYYFTLSATNPAGLTSLVAASNTYRHTSILPMPGLVLDFDPLAELSVVGGASYHRADVDVTLSETQLGIRWAGFSHPSDPVNLYAMLGTGPSLSDVVPEVFLGMGLDRYVFQNLSLQEGVRYYGTVIAETGLGRVNASSNGVTYLGSVTSPTFVGVVWDGLGEEDLDYHASSSLVSARWSFPESLQPLISHYMWAIVKENISQETPSQLPGTSGSGSGSGSGVRSESSSDVDDEDTSTEVVAEYLNVGRDSRGIRSASGLEAGPVRYRSEVRACIASTCFLPVYSDGFYIATPPRGGKVRGVYTPLSGIDSVYGTSSHGWLNVSWAEFEGPSLVYYEWDLSSDNRQLLPWMRVESSQQEVSMVINITLSLHRAHTVRVRAVNSAGLCVTATTSVEWNRDGRVILQNQVSRSPLLVYDVSSIPTTTDVAVSSWRDVRHVQEIVLDIDYIDHTSLSATWPDLRYTTYSYSLSSSQTYTPCPSTSNIACGSTHLNYATVTGPDVQDSEMYYFCVRALVEDAIHPTSSTPNVLEACSNGVTVDLTPPLGSCLKIADLFLGTAGDCSTRNDSVFQSSSSELLLIWEEFVDQSGVIDYSYAIGTRPYDTSVVNYTSVGVATSALVRGLSLQSGGTYTASLRAVDVAGLSSVLVSRTITIDTSPPVVIGVRLEHPDQFQTHLSLEWDLMQDRQSGISDLEWGLGTRPGSSDVSGWNRFTWNEGTGLRLSTQGLPLYGGQLVFASIKVRNGAGLVTMSSSSGIILDSSPPVPGVVFDGPPPPNGVLDVEYWSDVRGLSAHWSTFSEPQSTLTGYWWAIGSCHGCTDTQPFIPVGLKRSSSRAGLSLAHGGSYYVTVRACNSLGLCSQATSNGVTVDVTPPTSGRVYDGPVGGGDLQYQTSPFVVSAHWTGFHDTQSSLRHLVFLAGSSPNMSDIVPPVTLPSTQSWHMQLLDTPLGAESQVFVTVVAVNRAGLSSTSFSDGVVVDFTSPVSHDSPVIQTRWVGSEYSHAQFSSSSLRLEWNFTDNSAMQYYYIGLMSGIGTFIPIPPLTAFLQSSLTFSRLTLSDGDSYYVMVRGCDVGGVCVSATSSPVRVDSSPPIDGYFAVNGLNSNASLLSWRNRPVRDTADISLAFFGFSDPHSQVVQYWARAGTRVSGDDLMSVSLLAVSSRDNGSVFTAILPLNRQLTIFEIVHVTVWAVNGAGLESRAVHGSFVVNEPSQTNRGSLTLVRSPCQVASCLGHCSCAARGDLCNVPASVSSTCQRLNVSTISSSMQIQVFNHVPQLITSPTVYASGRLVTSITDKLYGRWTYSDNPADFQRVEWSVGVLGEEPGEGLMDVVGEEVWRESSSNNSAIFAVSQQYPLMEGQTYVFYVRVWYTSEVYAIFTSEGVIVDWRRHQVPTGRRVADTVGGGVADVDFTSVHSSLSLYWANVFLSTPAASYSTLEVGLGNAPGSANIYQLTSVVSMATSYTASGLDLDEGVVYYGMVRATNPLGEVTITVSDGVRLDVTPPGVGVVLSGRGRGYVTSRAQAETDRFTARWFGFSDAESAIDHYELSITDSPDLPTVYDRVGISLWSTITRLSLIQGQTYYAHVVAVNGAGLRSPDVASEGVVIQTMAPEGRECVFVDTVPVINPSFDNASYNGYPCPRTLPDVSMVTSGWETSVSYVVIASYPEIPPADGCHSIGLIGSISQSFSTAPGTEYTLQLSYSGYHGASQVGVRVQLPGVDQLLVAPYKDQVWRWSAGRVNFRAEDSLSRMTLSSAFTDSVVYVDDVRITSCTQYSSLAPAALPQAIRLTPSVISGSRLRLRAEWNVEDELSGIKEYLWAIGTVAMGGQLQPYSSTGHVRSGASREITVTHGQQVYVTVVARSNAGRELVVNSTGHVVDLTAPGQSSFIQSMLSNQDQSLVWDGIGQVEVDYQNSPVVAVNWAGLTNTGLSSLQTCGWAIGSAPGWSDIQNYLVIDVGSSQVTTSMSDLSAVIEHGTTVYSTVVCSDEGRLTSSATSNGLTILLEPPSSNSAYIDITSPSYTTYSPQDGYVPSSSVTLCWGGFSDSAGTPLLYEARILEEGEAVASNWTDVSSAELVTVSDLMVPEYPTVHLVQVRAVNLAGGYSDAVSANFSIVPFSPADSGIAINDTWIGNSVLELEWSQSFISSIPLYYELSVGVQKGSGSILKWLEISSLQCSYRVTAPYLFRDMDYFVTVTAVNSAGLHASISQLVPGIPISGL